ncbi:hypothetical protein EKH55_3834 [Sinorhizobium alkalisoli]|nr:hypothetical protein EKH55_3834 [Sinorhizobium alkalisoli]
MHYRPQKRSLLFTAPGLVIGALAVGSAGGMSVSPADVLALIEKPHLLIAVLFVCSATTKMRRSVNQDETRQQRWNAERA